MIENCFIVFLKNIYRMFIKNWKLFESKFEEIYNGSRSKNSEIILEIKSISYILEDEKYVVNVYHLLGGNIGITIDFPSRVNIKDEENSEIRKSNGLDDLKPSYSKYQDTEEMEEFSNRLNDICIENNIKIKTIHESRFSRNYQLDTGYKPKITYTVLPPR
jgi:hypothetical protein